jgi:hypothetical protein
MTVSDLLRTWNKRDARYALRREPITEKEIGALIAWRRREVGDLRDRSDQRYAARFLECRSFVLRSKVA